jgi:ABC-type multidrug transport system fused ATPase/permease subunit
MAEYADRYDIGSLESTERRYSDLGLMKRLIVDYMLRHKRLLTLVVLLVLLKTFIILSGPYIYKVTLDFFINDTPTEDALWLADIIRALAMTFSGNVAVPTTASILFSAALLYVLVSIAQWIVTSIQTYYMDKLGLIIIADIR